MTGRKIHSRGAVYSYAAVGGMDAAKKFAEPVLTRLLCRRATNSDGTMAPFTARLPQDCAQRKSCFSRYKDS